MRYNSAVDAPWNHLQLYQSLLRFEAINKVVSKSAAKAFSQHLWYLTSEMVPFALFNSKVPAEELCTLADRLLAVKPEMDLESPRIRLGTGFGKPKFPLIISLSTALLDLVESDSWFMFYIL